MAAFSCPNTETPFDSLVCSNPALGVINTEYISLQKSIESRGDNKNLMAEILLKDVRIRKTCSDVECARRWLEEQNRLLRSIDSSGRNNQLQTKNDSTIQSIPDLRDTSGAPVTKKTAKKESTKKQAQHELRNDSGRGQLPEKGSSIQNRPEAELTPSQIRKLMLFFLSLLAVATVIAIIRDIVRSRANEKYFNKKTKIGYGFALAGMASIGFGAIWTEYSFVAFLISSIPYLTFLHGEYMSCPSCFRWWARAQTDYEELEKWIETKTVNRQDHTKDRQGRIIATHHRKEQVLVECRKVKITYGCKHCGHTWHKIKTYKK
ncbi:MAG TPA: hypothetical protein PK281_10645 [Flavobacteriales bacterium]|nr:hypothetical protein [Flavobacteriales bacterium]